MRIGFNSFLSGLLFALFILLPLSALGQTASDFETKYGRQKYYKIRPLSFIWPQYDAQGLMCRAVIVPTRDPNLEFSDDPGDVDITEVPTSFRVAGPPIYVLNVVELRSIIDELIPAKNRIRKGTAQLDISGFGVSYRVDLKFGNFVIRNRIAVIDPPMNLSSSDSNGYLDHFFEKHLNDITSVEIVWTTRTCSDKR